MRLTGRCNHLSESDFEFTKRLKCRDDRLDEVREKLAEMHASAFAWAMVCCQRDRDIAAEVLQQAYCRILGGTTSFTGKSEFSTWVFGIIRHVAYEEIRTRQKEQQRFRSNVDSSLEATATTFNYVSIEQQELSTQLLAALEELSDRQRDVLHLTFYEDMTIEQAAEVLQVTVGSARQHYHRGKASLQRKLKVHWKLER